MTSCLLSYTSATSVKRSTLLLKKTICWTNGRQNNFYSCLPWKCIRSTKRSAESRKQSASTWIRDTIKAHWMLQYSFMCHIRHNFRTYPYTRTVKQIRRLPIAVHVILSTSLYIICFFIIAYVVGTHLKCLDKSRKFKWAPATYAL